MKKNYKQKFIDFFKEKPEKALIIVILVFVVFSSIYASFRFYQALFPKSVVLGELDYKELKIRVKNNVLEELENRQILNYEMQQRVDKVNDPFE